MAQRSPGGSSLLLLPLTCCCLLRLAQAGVRLTLEEERQVFGDRNPVPIYSVIEPRVVEGEGEERRHPRHTRSSHSQGPLLQFNALGRSFNFKLEPNSDLLSPYFVLIGRHREMRDIRPINQSQVACFYQGVELTDGNNTTIAVELCDVVRGVIASLSGEYVIEPLPEGASRRRRRSSTQGHHQQEQEGINSYTHVIYAKEDNGGYTAVPKSRKRRSFLTPLQEEEERAALGSRPERRSYYDSYEHVVDSRMRSEWGSDHHNNRYDDRIPDRKDKRGEDLYIETAVFVDQDLYRHMHDNFPRDTEDQVLKVVLAMVNAVQLLYNDASLGHSVKFVLKRLEILYSDPSGLRRPNDIDTFLTNFCTWQRQENPADDAHPMHWDHALILTGLDVFTIDSNGRVNSQVVGLAPVAGMCTRSSSCTVNEGRHFESVYVMAHEIGHNLGMRHDGLQAGNNCDSGRYLMSPTLGSGKITWSPCSRRYLDDFLRSSQASCVRDVATPDRQQMDHEAHSLPGQRFSADQQCMLKHGTGSQHANTQRLEEICQDLHCKRDHYTWTSHPALEGTTCGHRKWCQRGRCKEDPNAPGLSSSSSSSSSSSYQLASSLGSSSGSSEAGVGGTWGSWSKCRSSCLYGVDGILSSGSTGLALSEKRCSSCRGEYRYRVCSAVQDCLTGQRKTLQDFADETCRRRSKNSAFLTGLAARVPPEGLSHCEVECETTGTGIQESGESYPDGTVCQSPTALPAFCVTGVCTEFRCDPYTLYGADPLTCRPDMGVPDPHRPLGPNDPLSRPPTTLAPTRSTSTTTRPGKCLDWSCTGVSKNIQVCNPPNPVDCSRLRTTFEYASEVCGRFKSEVDQLSGVGMQLASTRDDPDRACTVACQDAVLNYRFYRVNGKDGWFPFGTDCSKGRQGDNSYCLNGKCLDFSDEGTPLRNTIYTEYERARSLDLEPIIERDFPREVRPVSSRRWLGSWGRRRRDVSSSSSSSSSAFRDQRDALRSSRRRRRNILSSSKRHQNDINSSRQEGKDDSSSSSSSSRRWSSWRRRRPRDVTSSSYPISSTISDTLLLTLVAQINDTLTSVHELDSNTHLRSSIDFKNPLFVDQGPPPPPATSSRGQGSNFTVTLKPHTFTLTPLNPRVPANSTSSFSGAFDQEVLGPREYRWRVVVMPCSVTCDVGLQEVVVMCTVIGGGADEEVTEASLCSPDPPPMTPGFRRCGREIRTGSFDGALEGLTDAELDR
ncbi:A disintegrin and metalloproteinase with thrombospondin motifs adt-1-like 3 [Homarus americanus]|uniref:A disintegrin and metalloproteinase with thrombospondin motifs adt-1-like 3 n=1 Tax=Homarus americanus TaxID=6706 RepID=A0A8J5K0E7_HOMAM|nr:A disintegrin and metalloproteinase with thrombospondin motifs adt-1-like 3 [Homarus americanus]